MDVMFADTMIARRHLDLGLACFHNHEFALAVAAFDAALALTPDDPYARWNRATALLSLGEYERGFVEHDVAWRLFNWRGFSTIGDVHRLAHLPLWRGERDARVIAYHELGFGDAIMAMRFLPELAARCELTLVIDQCLVRLAERFDDVAVASQLPEDITAFDYRLPFFGVMSALHVTATTIPALPYIDTRIARLPHQPMRKIGVAWSGRTQTAFTLERFLQLGKLDGFDLYALQPGVLTENWIDPLPPGCDFLDVAERIAQMDAIVSVDTAAIHLAGAMGHPNAHLVLPHLMDWRWWRSELWYPQLKTYRQATPPDWSAPFAHLNEALARAWVTQDNR
jgi:hypothetical protein